MERKLWFCTSIFSQPPRTIRDAVYKLFHRKKSMSHHEVLPHHSYVRLHIDAFLLALASSTDNFTVGLSVGLLNEPLPIWANAFISICNATGALIASLMGSLLATSSSLISLLLAALAFGYLCYGELQTYFVEKRNTKNSNNHTTPKKDDDNIDNHKNMLNIQHVIGLALPMTLNNLAGGVAGGAVGLTPFMASSYALLASFVTMSFGHFIGQRLLTGKASDKLPIEPPLLAAILLGILCLVTLHEAYGIWLNGNE